jgi:1-acyl-sn-glycerol-3-phosphate acyltransferase
MNQITASPILAAPPSDEFVPSWASLCWYEGCALLNMTAFTLGFSYRKEGQHHVPKTGPLLVLANHQSFLDPMAAGLACPRQLIYLARKTLFRNRYFTRLIRSLNAVPIDQEGVGKEGLRTIIEQLQRGRAVLVFPEGERTLTGRMYAFKPGIHLLIKRTLAPILPLGIAGAYEAWPRWRNYPMPAPLFWPSGTGTIAVSVGRPLDPRPYAEMPREQALAELFTEIDRVQRRAERLRRR